MKDFTDSELIENYFKGDEQALAVLFSRYLKPVYNFVSQFAGDLQEAEDITQNAFVKAWKNLKKFNKEKKFKPWIFQIAKNTSLDYLRKKKAIAMSEFENEEGDNILLETMADPDPLPSEIFDRSNLAAEAAVAIAQMPLKDRLVLNLYFDNDFTFQEIADLTGEPLNTVKSRQRRALIKLRKKLMHQN